MLTCYPQVEPVDFILEMCLNYCMIVKSLLKAIKSNKPTVVKENGAPRYVILDWDTYQMWEEVREDLEDSQRLREAIFDPKNQKKITWANTRKKPFLK